MDTPVRDSNKLMDVYVTGLRNQHAVENQAIELLTRQVERLENYPAMRERLRAHIEESRVQARRLDELLAAANSSASSLKDTALSFMGNMAALAHAPAQDEVMKNTLANFAFEHFEIAAYKSLIAMTEVISVGNAASLLNQSLAEEIGMARWIDENIAETTRTYMSLHEAGMKAGV